MDRKQYGEDLLRRQRDHLDRVRGAEDRTFQPCAHDQCSQCHGTGIRHDGRACMHNLYCPCPKCSPRCMTVPTGDTSFMGWQRPFSIVEMRVAPEFSGLAVSCVV